MKLRSPGLFRRRSFCRKASGKTVSQIMKPVSKSKAIRNGTGEKETAETRLLARGQQAEGGLPEEKKTGLTRPGPPLDTAAVAEALTVGIKRLAERPAFGHHHRQDEILEAGGAEDDRVLVIWEVGGGGQRAVQRGEPEREVGRWLNLGWQ